MDPPISINRCRCKGRAGWRTVEIGRFASAEIALDGFGSAPDDAGICI